jgi:hypothetical protein
MRLPVLDALSWNSGHSFLAAASPLAPALSSPYVLVAASSCHRALSPPSDSSPRPTILPLVQGPAHTPTPWIIVSRRPARPRNTGAETCECMRKLARRFPGHTHTPYITYDRAIPFSPAIIPPTHPSLQHPTQNPTPSMPTSRIHRHTPSPVQPTNMTVFLPSQRKPLDPDTHILPPQLISHKWQGITAPAPYHTDGRSEGGIGGGVSRWC